MNQVLSLASMDEAITESGLDTFYRSDGYRPDVANHERMHRLQIELARQGVSTVFSSVYQRGRTEPISYAIRRPVEPPRLLAPVVRLDDYR